MNAPEVTRRTQTPRSRGRIICDTCYTTVPAGVTYRRDVWKDGTYHWSIRYCPDCWQILNRVEAYVQPFYGGPEADDFELWAANHIDAPGAQEWALRAFPP